MVGAGGGRIMANYGIFRIKKYDGGSIRGIEKHVERQANSSNTNPDIDWSKTKNNFDLHNQCGTYRQSIQRRLGECGIEKVRKNAVQMVELLFTASHEFFQGKSNEEMRQYFQDCYEWACNKYGKENIISAQVPLDERTPHLHLEFVPIKDGKLNARELFKRPLTELQNEVHKQVFEKYGLDRGENSQEKRQHISTLNYKVLTLQKEIDTKQQELAKLNNEQLFKMKRHIQELSKRLQEMMEVIESDPELMQEYLQARDKLFKNKDKHELSI